MEPNICIYVILLMACVRVRYLVSQKLSSGVLIFNLIFLRDWYVLES
jgi:hypothetical protein